jgi:hypothetical protein
MPLAYALVVVTSLCGAALATYLLGQTWEYLRQSLGSLSAAQRRQFVKAQVATWGSMLIAAGFITAAYQWGSSDGSSRTGAAIAIGAFVIVIIAIFLGFGMAFRWEARRDRESHVVKPE